jgi:hypothetical protein
MAYYFTVLALPPLSLKSPPEMSFQELKKLCALNLKPSDFNKLSLLLQTVDIYNIKAFWLGFPLDDRGNYQAKDLEEALLVKEQIPPYVIDYLDQYESTSERLKNFSSLYVSLFEKAAADEGGFLLKYFTFEREVRLILTALRAKQMGRDLPQELQFEDAEDPFVAYILAQKDAPDFMPPLEYEELKTLFVENRRDPEKLNRAILQYRFDRIEEMEDEKPFEIDAILGYAARLLILEDWHRLDKEKGNTAVEQLSQYG